MFWLILLGSMTMAFSKTLSIPSNDNASFKQIYNVFNEHSGSKVGFLPIETNVSTKPAFELESEFFKTLLKENRFISSINRPYIYFPFSNLIKGIPLGLASHKISFNFHSFP